MSAVISLTKAQVPSYLMESEFYKNLSADDEDAFDIPQQFFKRDVSIKNAGDLAHLFHTMKFWGLSKLPREIILLLIFKPNSFPADEHELICNVILEFDAEFGLYTLYQNLSKCSWDHQRLDLAIQSGKVDLLEHIIQYHMLGGHWDFVMIKSAAENGHLHILKRILDSSTVPIKNPFREVSVSTVASGGHTDCLRYLFEKGCKKQQDTCRAAAENGHISCLKLAHKHGCVWNKTVRNAAASHGRLECLKYTFEHGCPVDTDVACEAAKGGQLECLQYILDQGVKITKRIGEATVIGGSIECLRLLCARGAPTWTVTCANFAALSGCLCCLQYLLNAGCKVDHTTTLVASLRGHVHCLELLLETNCEVRTESVVTAAERGHLACLTVLKKFGVSLCDEFAERGLLVQIQGDGLLFVRSLHEAGYEIPQSLIEYAVQYGHLECVKYICEHKLCILMEESTLAAAKRYLDDRLPVLQVLHQHNCPWHEDVCVHLACHHDLESLTFAHTFGAPWDKATTYAAIQVHGLDCLMYALKEGCPLDKGACDVAASRGLCNVLQLLHERGCLLSLKTCIAAAKSKYVACLTYAINHGAPVDESVCEAAATYYLCYQESRNETPQTPLEVLQCARRLGCPWDERTCAEAAKQPSDIACLQYAHENGCPWDVSTTNAAVVLRGNPSSALAYAVKNGCPCGVDTCLAAVERGDLGSLKFLREHGCPWDEQVSRAAAKRSGGSCLTYCVEKSCPMDAATMIVYNNMIRILDAGLDDASY